MSSPARSPPRSAAGVRAAICVAPAPTSGAASSLVSQPQAASARWRFAFFERELQLVGIEPLRMPPELCALELANDLAHPLDAAEQFVALGDQRQRRRPQTRHVSGKRVGRRHRSPASTLFRLAPLALLQALIESPAAARSVVRTPASRSYGVDGSPRSGRVELLTYPLWR